MKQLLNEVETELLKSYEKHSSFKGSHEGYAVILEELDELWDEVKKHERNFKLMRKECIQIAAMAIKFARDICDKENIR
jgi:hypothetical protein